MSEPVKLANGSALGTYRARWTSADGVRMAVFWGEGMSVPMASRGLVSTNISRPERFGWKKPRNYKEFRCFAQAFADEFEAGYGDDRTAGQMTARHEAGWVPDTRPARYQGKHKSAEEREATRGYQLCPWCMDCHFRAYPEYPDTWCQVRACQCWCGT